MSDLLSAAKCDAEQKLDDIQREAFRLLESVEADIRLMVDERLKRFTNDTGLHVAKVKIWCAAPWCAAPTEVRAVMREYPDPARPLKQ